MKHIIDGEFQSDKYPTTPRGKVPLSVRDVTAQDLLWEYAQRRRVIDAEFADDLEIALRNAGFVPRLDTMPTLTHILPHLQGFDLALSDIAISLRAIKRLLKKRIKGKPILGSGNALLQRGLDELMTEVANLPEGSLVDGPPAPMVLCPGCGCRIRETARCQICAVKARQDGKPVAAPPLGPHPGANVKCVNCGLTVLDHGSDNGPCPELNGLKFFQAY